MRAHRTDHLASRWSYFSWFGLLIQGKDDGTAESSFQREETRTVNIAVTLDHLEAILIIVAEPPLNKQGGSLGSNVEEFVQCDSKGVEVPGEPNADIKAILDRISSLEGRIEKGIGAS